MTSRGLEQVARERELGVADPAVGHLEPVDLFEAERVSADFGSEIDLLIQAKWRKWSAVVKYADYQADGFATDTSKFWAQLEYIY